MSKRSDCDIIIPVKIDSDDRRRNCEIVLNYLLDNLNYKISLIEVGSKEVRKIIKTNNSNFDYYHLNLDDDQPFHKTKYLNFLAKRADTSVVCCYDIDVILPVDTYKIAVEKLISGELDVVYPYNEGMFQKKVFLPENFQKLENIDEYPHQMALSLYGHCNFQRKDVYEKAGYENEDFISYGPEDQEKLYRYSRLGYRVGRTDNYIYHLEHSRGKDSETHNPYYEQNMKLFNNLKNMSDLEFNEYCNKLKGN